MLTKVIVIVGVCVAICVAMVVMGSVCDAKKKRNQENGAASADAK